MLHIPPTNLLCLAAKQEPYIEAYLSTKNIEGFSGKSSREWAGMLKKRYGRKNNRSRQKKKRKDSKVESNDSPEIPDRGGDIRHPWRLEMFVVYRVHWFLSKG